MNFYILDFSTCQTSVQRWQDQKEATHICFFMKWSSLPGLSLPRVKLRMKMNQPKISFSFRFCCCCLKKWPPEVASSCRQLFCMGSNFYQSSRICFQLLSMSFEKVQKMGGRCRLDVSVFERELVGGGDSVACCLSVLQSILKEKLATLYCWQGCQLQILTLHFGRFRGRVWHLAGWQLTWTLLGWGPCQQFSFSVFWWVSCCSSWRRSVLGWFWSFFDVAHLPKI